MLNRPDRGTTVVYRGSTDIHLVNGMIYRVASLSYQEFCDEAYVPLELDRSPFVVCAPRSMLELAAEPVSEPVENMRAAKPPPDTSWIKGTTVSDVPRPFPQMAEEAAHGWTTKDSGVRARFASGMVRDTNEGKPRFDLLFAEGVSYEDQFLTRVAGLLARGAEKYHARNWEQANSQEEIDRMRESAARHFAQWMSGDTDEDHAAAIVFNLLAAETTKLKLSKED